jgi:hypothetical protein
VTETERTNAHRWLNALLRTIPRHVDDAPTGLKTETFPVVDGATMDDDPASEPGIQGGINGNRIDD